MPTVCGATSSTWRSTAASSGPTRPGAANAGLFAVQMLSTMDAALAKNPAVEHVFLINGFDLISGGAKTSSATLFLAMKPWEERTISAQQMVGAVFGAGAGIRDALVIPSTLDDALVARLGHRGGEETKLELGVLPQEIRDLEGAAGEHRRHGHLWRGAHSPLHPERRQAVSQPTEWLV